MNPITHDSLQLKTRRQFLNLPVMVLVGLNRAGFTDRVFDLPTALSKLVPTTVVAAGKFF